jgi:uncharacterized protein (TIGR03067 family)
MQPTGATQLRAAASGLLWLGFVLMPAAARARDADALQGVWRVVNYKLNGQSANPDSVRRADVRLTFKGDRMVLTMAAQDPVFGGRVRQHWTYVLDPSREPRTIDITRPAIDSEESVTVHGIYSLDKDGLMILTAAPGHPRPAALLGGDAPTGTLMVLKRPAASPDMAKAGPVVDPAVVGVWAGNIAVNGLNMAATFNLLASGAYRGRVEGSGNFPEEMGRFTARDGKWSLRANAGPMPGRSDGGTYKVIDADTLRLAGQTGTFTWKRVGGQK